MFSGFFYYMKKLKTPLVSVVMSVYNEEKFVSESIESILNQTYGNFEFIIIDDGSTDNTINIIEKYKNKDKRIKLIKKNKKKKYSRFTANLNEGIDIAKGKYIARMDGDDVSFRTRLEKQVKYLEKNSKIYLVGTGRFLINEFGNIIGVRFGFVGSKKLEKKTPFCNYTCHSTIMFRKDDFRYRDKFICAQDYDFYLRLISNGKKFNNLFVPLAKQRFTAKSVSVTKSSIQNKFSKNAVDFFNQRKNNGFDAYKEMNVNKIMNLNLEKEVSALDNIKNNFRTGNYTLCAKLSFKYLKKNGYFNLVLILFFLSKFPIIAQLSKQVVHFYKSIKFYLI